ncbi:MAG: hypothetical protein ABI286_11430 [Edaphobacter sp.]
MSENQHLVRDVVVQTTVHDLRVSDELFRREPPIDGRVELTDDLWIGSLGLDAVEAVLDACGPPGLNFRPTRQFGHHYCVIREQRHSHFPSVKWDEDQRLRDCIALSRLVHPTTISTHFSARLFYKNAELSMIVPGPTGGLGAYAFVNGPVWRNWLTKSDAAELGNLLALYDFGRMPNRLRRAMRHFQYASLTYEFDVRFTLVVTGLEALVNTRDSNVSAQFKKRLLLTAQDVGMIVSEEQAREAYSYRSNLSHGQRLQGNDIERQTRSSYEMLETLLRKLIKKAIDDQVFSGRFESETTIDAAYPI